MILNKRSLPASFQLIKLIAELDKMVFEKDAIREIVFVEKEIGEEMDCFAGYHPEHESPEGKEYYTVHECLDNKIQKVLPTQKHIYINEVLSHSSWEDLQTFTEEEFLVGLAAHEVRHRVQERFQTSLFSPEEKKKTKNKDLKALLVLIEMKLKKEAFLTANDFLKEFDACIIEYLAAKKWHEGANFQEIVKIIKKSAEEFRED